MKNKRILFLSSICILVSALLVIIGGKKLYAYYQSKDTSRTVSQDLTVTKKEMLEDYDTLWKDIEENYPYLTVAGRVTGKDFNKIKEDYREKAEGAVSLKEFATVLNNCINEFEGTGHMKMFFDDSTYADYLEIYKGPENAHCKILYKRLNNPVSKKYYHYNGNKGDTDKEKSTTGTEEPSNRRINFMTQEYESLKTAYVKIPSFVNADVNVPALKECFTKIKDYNNCIIDLRGNGGGNDYYWTEGIVSPNLKEDVKVSYDFLIKGNVSKSYAKSEFKVLPIKKLDTSSLSHLNTEDFSSMDYYCAYASIFQKQKDPVFKGKFYVLTDESNYSSSESFVAFCKRTGFATLVGERTGGDGMGIDPMITVLPNTGICLRFSALYSMNADGSCNEEYGTEPDVESGDRDALGVCMELIKK